MRRGPKKLFYKIGEVCELCGLEPHVLRYWEEEFPPLSPSKNRAGQRIYREKDLALIRQIKDLLYVHGFTIAGARRRLKQSSAGKALPLFSPTSARRREAVAEISRQVEAILGILDGSEDSQEAERVDASDSGRPRR